MKILIVLGGFFPGKKYGGPPVSVDNFCSLMTEFECYVVTRNHDMGEKAVYKNINKGWNDRTNCKVLYLSDREYNKRSFDKVISEIKPDVLYLHGLYQSCVYPCLQLSKKRSLKVLLAPRGELCAGALRKKFKKFPYIAAIRFMGLLHNVTFQSTSDEETGVIKRYLGVKDNRIKFLSNIPSIPKRNYSSIKKTPGQASIVFLSRIHPQKNLLSAIEYFVGVKGNVRFDIYGPIEDKDYWQQCHDAIINLPEDIAVQYRGMVSHDEVHEILSKYNAMLLPTLSENYGHAIVEALFVGTPVIISDQTPWTDVNDCGASWAIPLQDEDKFTCAIQTIIDHSENQRAAQRTVIQAYLQKKLKLHEKKEEYKQVLTEVIVGYVEQH